MADYIEITDEEIQPGAPYTTGLAAKMRDNHLAVAEGAAGAPRIMAAAIGQIEASTSDSNIFLRKDSTQTTSSMTEVAAATFNIGQSGSVNVYLELNISQGAAISARAVVRRNGTSVATYSHNQPTYEANNVNVNVTKGDVITVGYYTDAGGRPAGIRRIRLRGTNAISPWSVT